jgi:glycosyltransferase involved in cell wall biosynthesis
VSRLDVPRLLYRARSPRALRALERELRAGRFDLVHAHCVFSPLAHAATFLARRLGIASVFTLHSDLGGPGGAALSALHALLGWGRWPTVMTAVSRYVAAQLGAVTARSDVELLPNAAHLDRWHNDADAASRPLRIAAAMRFTRRKRPAALVRLFPSLLARLPRASWPTLTLVGDGPEMPAVRRAVARLGLSLQVELPGYLDHDALATLLARSSIFVVPSRREALSIAAIEARAAGLPVVARVPSGVAEVVAHGRHGLLARSDCELVDALATLCADAPLRARMSDEARRGLDEFAWTHCLARHEEVYRLALARHAR